MQELVNFLNCKRATLGPNNGDISGAELMVWVGRRRGESAWSQLIKTANVPVVVTKSYKKSCYY